MGPVEGLEWGIQRSADTLVVHLGLTKWGLNHSALYGDPALVIPQEMYWQCVRHARHRHPSALSVNETSPLSRMSSAKDW